MTVITYTNVESPRFLYIYIVHRAIIYWHCLYAALVGQYRAGLRAGQNGHLHRGPHQNRPPPNGCIIIQDYLLDGSTKWKIDKSFA